MFPHSGTPSIFDVWLKRAARKRADDPRTFGDERGFSKVWKRIRRYGSLE